MILGASAAFLVTPYDIMLCYEYSYFGTCYTILYYTVLSLTRNGVLSDGKGGVGSG